LKSPLLWAAARGVTLDFIQPGKPTQNAFIESFNGILRDDCLNLHWFQSIEDARHTIQAWRIMYNQGRPHSSLGRLTPQQLADQHALGLDHILADITQSVS